MTEKTKLKVGKQPDGSIVSVLLFNRATKNTHRYDEQVSKTMPISALYQRKEKGFEGNPPQGVIVTVAPLDSGDYTIE